MNTGPCLIACADCKRVLMKNPVSVQVFCDQLVAGEPQSRRG
ncbi:hypothetical protein APV28_4328 [Comamonas testosteroni]|nr:hypothetical protein APV28_4328 [Comamonas testosteroni]